MAGDSGHAFVDEVKCTGGGGAFGTTFGFSDLWVFVFTFLSVSLTDRSNGGGKENSALKLSLPFIIRCTLQLFVT